MKEDLLCQSLSFNLNHAYLLRCTLAVFICIFVEFCHNYRSISVTKHNEK